MLKEPSHKPAMFESRKFRALALACGLYSMPIAMMFVLAIKGVASKDDLVVLTKWASASLSPIFLAYIGGVAYEDSRSRGD